MIDVVQVIFALERQIRYLELQRDKLHQKNDIRAELFDEDALRLRDAVSLIGAPQSALNWAVGQWRAEVENRPLVNVHRRTLDDTWRQVIRFAGGDPDELVGPSHDVLVARGQS
jgi:hypothetical protein